jgi:uncharacterized membrane protein
MADIENNPAGTKNNGMLCYLAGVLFPIIYLSSEPYKSNSFLRFHSFQSIIFTLIWGCLTIIDDGSVRFQTKGVSTTLSAVWFLFLISWIVLMFNAYRGRKMKLPVVGNLAERLSR